MANFSKTNKTHNCLVTVADAASDMAFYQKMDVVMIFPFTELSQPNKHQGKVMFQKSCFLPACSEELQFKSLYQQRHAVV
mmetsp:Transcript_30730/g.45825  ORF Transcript_30730/g.45825 Transcript_30730/m.45825 type:complete len:80 (+) Transcript_30730:1429-1668(+)